MHSTSKYSIRGLTAEEARPEVLELWRRLGRSEADARRSFDWAFDARARCFLLDASNTSSAQSTTTAVGMVGVFAREVFVDGHKRSAALLGGFHVEKSHRTFFPALSLQRATIGWARREFDLVYGFPNDSAKPILNKLGLRDLTRLERHILLLRHAAYVGRVVRRRALAGALGASLDGYRLLVRPGLIRGAPRGRGFERFDNLDERFERLFAARTFADHSFGGRDATFLRRRFLERPDERTTVYGLYSLRTGELDAWVVVHGGNDVGNVRDLQGRDVNAMCTALRLVAARVRKEGCVALSFLCSPPPALRAGLAALGFRQRPSSRVMLGLPSELLSRNPNLDRWYLTEADEDQ
jgi:hypothetical protein